MATTNAPSLQEHIRGTYRTLRLGIGGMGIALPVILGVGGALLDREPLRGSMSAYYYSGNLRDVFVGGLIAIGVALVLYKGFSRREDWALNAAGVLAAGVALVPTGAPGSPSGGSAALHGGLAVGFFACIAYVCLFRASDTLSLIRDVREAKRLRRRYRILGAALIGSPLLAASLALLLQEPGGGGSLIFFAEAVAVWVFGAYWLLKSGELKRTEAERLAAEGKLQMSTTAGAAPGRVVQVEPDELPRLDWRAWEGAEAFR